MDLLTEFSAAMTKDEFEAGEELHRKSDLSRKLAMASALTKNSEELARVWDKDQSNYLTVLREAVAAYDHFELVGELLSSSIARLLSVVDTDSDSEIIEAALAIVARARKPGDSVANQLHS